MNNTKLRLTRKLNKNNTALKLEITRKLNIQPLKQLSILLILLYCFAATHKMGAIINPENMLASGSEDKTIKIWDLSAPNGKKCVQTITGHNGGVRSVAFAPKVETKEQKEFKTKLFENTKPIERKPEHPDFGKKIKPPFSDTRIRLLAEQPE